MFKKPIDPYKGLSKDEIEKKMDEFAENDFDKEDEKALLSAAFTTLFPAVIGVCLVFGLIIWLITMFM